MKFYVIIGSIFVVIGLFVGAIVYTVKLKNEINDLTQQNLIFSEKTQQQDLTIKAYTKQNTILQKTLNKLQQQKTEDIKELSDIDNIKISDNKQQELLDSLKLN